MLFLLLVCSYAGAALLFLTVGFEVLPDNLSWLRSGSLLAGLTGILSLYLISRSSSMGVVRAKLLLFLWLGQGICSIISSLVHYESLYSVASECWLAFGVPAFFFWIVPIVGQSRIHIVNALALASVHIAYLLLSFAIDPNFRFLYRGIFGHPNQVGVIAATAATVCLSGLIVAYLRPIVRKRLVLGCCLAAFVMLTFVVVASGSRTALAALIVAVCAAVAFVGRFDWLLKFILPGMLAVFGAVALVDSVTGTNVVQALLAKHDLQVRGGNVLSGRELIWSRVIADASWLGQGSDYYSSFVGISAHNSFLHILGKRGIVAALFMLAFAVGTVWTVYKRIPEWRSACPERAFSCLLVVCFWSISMGEATFSSIGTSIPLSFYVAVGALISAAAPRYTYIVCAK